jgi:N-acetyl-1-D-myo-inositol-2-amino-2-deoxy-alpha-D-glucopyranoside deacetylase
VAEQLRLMCVHAHPDDEVIGTGGTLLRYASEGIATAVVTCTGGERGEIHNMDEAATRPRLAEVRRAELEQSLQLLGAGTPRLLGYVDSGMMGDDGNEDPASFWRAPLDEAIGRVVTHIRQFRPHVLITYDAFGGYGHPDHIQAHRVALLAAEACTVDALYPEAGPAWRIAKVYLSSFSKSSIFQFAQTMVDMGLESPFGEFERVEDVPMGSRDDELGAGIDVTAHLDDKLAALKAHNSQIAADSFFLTLPLEGFAQAFGQEWFIRHRSDVPAAGVEDDLFAGLR